MVDLTARLESIRELKAQYGIGSQSALRYLKVQDTMIGLADDVSARLSDEGLDYHPSVREISNLCEALRGSVKFTLDLQSEMRAVLALGRLAKDHHVESADPRQGMIESRTKGDHFSSPAGLFDVKWNLDYASMLVNFYRAMQLCGRTGRAFNAVMFNFISGKQAFLTGADGRQYTLNEICENDSFLAHEGRIPGDMLEEFVEAVKEKMSVAKAGIFGAGLKIDGLTEEEGKFLLQSGAYERAVREKTLHRMDTERRLALNELMQYVDFLKDHSAQELVDTRLSALGAQLDKRRELLRKVDGQSGAAFITERQKELVAQSSYYIRAIRQNRKWLENVLSN
ncbi:MAG TPA: hypothetical protein VI612_05390 [Candidatus Nanoarchaeia archaeon]|nr:hypothetical protein [Candidatus Nanoarchaeia archaeon]